eukprot:5371712-Pyramimonas_sp.AAC.2
MHTGVVAHFLKPARLAIKIATTYQTHCFAKFPALLSSCWVAPPCAMTTTGVGRSRVSATNGI